MWAVVRTTSWYQIYVVQIFSKPLVSLVKTIRYPESTRFYSKACDYILIHETDALHMYKYSMQATHDFFELKKVWVSF